MANSYDNRIVNVEFNNRQFEQGVAESTKSLNKFKQTLESTESTDSLKKLEKSANSLDFSSLISAAAAIEKRFTFTGGVMFNWLDSIEKKVVNTGQTLIKSLSVDQISEGYGKYEDKTKSVLTIMNATGKSAEEVNASLSKLNWFTDATSYNFVDMVNNIGKFTSAGVDLDVAITAMEGIATEAALSGQGINEASRAMYNFAQAIGTGAVKLMDWRSIENANMATQEFKQAIIDTAVAEGTLIKTTNGYKTAARGTAVSVEDFNTALSEGWFTSEVLTKSLSKYGEYADAVYEVSDAYDTVGEAMKAVNAEGMELGERAFKAAQVSKTWSDAINATKDAVSTSWMQTFENILGNTDESIEFWSTIEGKINRIFTTGSDQKVKLSAEWKEIGGRTILLESLYKILDGIGDALDSIREAWAFVFPPQTAEQLLQMTKNFSAFVDKIKPGEEALKKIKIVAQGVFSYFALIKDLLVMGFKMVSPVLKDVWSVIEDLALAVSNFFTKLHLDVVASGILDTLPKKAAEAWDSLKNSFKNADFLEPVINAFRSLREIIRSFGRSESGGGSGEDSDFTPMRTFIELIDRITAGVREVVERLSPRIGQAVQKISKAFAVIGEKASEVFNNTFSSENFVALFEGGGAAAILLFINNLFKPFKDFQKLFTTFNEGLDGMLKGLTSTLNAFAGNLRAKELLDISVSLLLLAAALTTLAFIEPDRLLPAAAALGSLAAGLVGLMELFILMSKYQKFKSPVGMLMGMASTMLTLAKAVEKIGSLPVDRMWSAVGGLGAMIVEIVGFSLLMSHVNMDMSFKQSLAFNTFIASLEPMAKALVRLGVLDWEQMGVAVVAMGAVLGEVVAFTRLLKGTNGLGKVGFAMIEISIAMNILVSAIRKFGEMDVDVILKGVAALGGIMAIFVASSALMKAMGGSGAKLIALGAAMIVIGTSLYLLFGAAKLFATMDYGELAKSAVALGGILLMISGASHLVDPIGIIAMSAAMLVFAGAMDLFIPAMLVFGTMTWEEIGKGLLVLAGAFAVLLAGVVMFIGYEKTILALTTSMVAWGTSMILLGVGLTALTIGMTAFAASADVIVQGFADFLTALKTYKLRIYTGLIDALSGFAEVIMSFISETVVGIVSGLYQGLSKIKELIAPIVETVMDAVLDALKAFFSRLPELAETVIGGLLGLVEAIVQSVSRFDVGELLLAVGVLTEIFAVMTLLTASSLEMLALSALLEPICTNFSKGFEALSPVFEKLKSIDPEIMASLLGFSEMIKALAMIEIMELFNAWVGIDTAAMFKKIGEDIKAFAPALVDFSNQVSGKINVTGIQKASEAAGYISEFAKNIPNTGGLVSWLFGDNELGQFSKSINEFGEAITTFATRVAGFGEEQLGNVERATQAASYVITMAKTIPNSGGIISWLMGDNDLGDFASNLRLFGAAITGFDLVTKDVNVYSVKQISYAAQTLTEVAANIPVTGGIWGLLAGDRSMQAFSMNISLLGIGLAAYADKIKDTDISKVSPTAAAAKVLTGVAAAVPTTGGIFGLVTGSNAFGIFAMNVGMLGDGLSKYSENIKGVDTSSVINSADAAVSLATFASKLPTTGGLWGLIVGDKSIKGFSNQLVDFAAAMKGFSDGIVGVNAKRVELIADAATSLGDFAASIPVTGGLWSLLAGDQKLGSFGDNLGVFAAGLKVFFTNAIGVNPARVTELAGAASELAGFASQIPVTGGFWTFVTEGTTDRVTTFATSIANFGLGMRDFYVQMRGVNTEVVKAGASAGVEVATIAQSFSGATDIYNMVNVSEYLPDFGSAMALFATNVKDTNLTRLERASDVAKTLGDMASELPTTGGLWSFFEGDSSLKTFGENLGSFASALFTFDTTVANVNFESVDKGIARLGRLVDAQIQLDGLSEDMVSISGLGQNLADFGYDLSDYVKFMKDVKTEDVDNAIATITSLAKMANDISDVNNTGVTNLMQGLTQMGAFNVMTFADTFSTHEEYIKGVVSRFVQSALNGVSEKYEEARQVFKSTFSAAVNAVIGDDVETFEKARSLGVTMMMAIKNGVVSNMEAIRSSATRLSIMMMNGFNQYGVDNGYADFASYFNAYGSRLIVNLSAGLGGELSQTLIFDKAKSIINKLISGLNSFEGSGSYPTSNKLYFYMFKLGENVSTGMADGMRSTIWKVESVAKQLADAVPSKVTKLLGIHSPSKVLEQIGHYTGVGYINGLAPYVEKSEEAAKNIVLATEDGFMEALEMVASVMDDDFEWEPVIRPVVDTSDIENGSEKISSLMNGSYGYTTAAYEAASRMNGFSAKSQPIASNSTTNNNSSAYNNNFYINGDDPRSIADEVSRILQKQVERNNAVWA